MLFNRMKLLILFCLIGCSLAAYQKELKDASDRIAVLFMAGMKEAPSLRSALDIPPGQFQEFDVIEEDIKIALTKKFQEILQIILDQIIKAVERGEKIGKHLFDKVKEIGEELETAGRGIKEDSPEFLKNVQKQLEELLIQLKPKIAAGDGFDFWGLLNEIKNDMKMKTILTNLKDMITDTVTESEIVQYINETLQGGRIARYLETVMNSGGVKALKSLLNMLLWWWGPTNEPQYSPNAIAIDRKQESNDINSLIETIGEQLEKVGLEMQTASSNILDKIKEKLDEFLTELKQEIKKPQVDLQVYATKITKDAKTKNMLVGLKQKLDKRPTSEELLDYIRKKVKGEKVRKYLVNIVEKDGVESLNKLVNILLHRSGTEARKTDTDFLIRRISCQIHTMIINGATVEEIKQFIKSNVDPDWHLYFLGALDDDFQDFRKFIRYNCMFYVPMSAITESNHTLSAFAQNLAQSVKTLGRNVQEFLSRTAKWAGQVLNCGLQHTKLEFDKLHEIARKVTAETLSSSKEWSLRTLAVLEILYKVYRPIVGDLLVKVGRNIKSFIKH